jgi:hypothetical protein
MAMTRYLQAQGQLRIDGDEVGLKRGQFVRLDPSAVRCPVAGPHRLTFVTFGSPINERYVHGTTKKSCLCPRSRRLRRVREVALVDFDDAFQLAFEPGECLLLQDPRARPGDPELQFDRIQRPLLSVEAEAKLEYLPFEVGQPGKG